MAAPFASLMARCSLCCSLTACSTGHARSTPSHSHRDSHSQFLVSECSLAPYELSMHGTDIPDVLQRVRLFFQSRSQPALQLLSESGSIVCHTWGGPGPGAAAGAHA